MQASPIIAGTPAGQARGIAPSQTSCRSPVIPYPQQGKRQGLPCGGGCDDGSWHDGWVGAMPRACPVAALLAHGVC
ncbi:MAG TPA: hypothetical protein VKY19_10690 [Ktedonosporobacter sp.]|nr:hypothetical protein [Ktedonosporobacter sp.]